MFHGQSCALRDLLGDMDTYGGFPTKCWAQMWIITKWMNVFVLDGRSM